MYKSNENKWSEISLEIPGRTDNDVKNQWKIAIKNKTIHLTEAFDKYLAQCLELDSANAGDQ